MSQTRVVGYVRVSTDKQVDEGYSLDIQRKKLEAYAYAMGLELVAIHEDAGISAKSLARPALQEALRDLSGGRADGLLVAKLDRLTRSIKDLGHLVETYFTSSKSLMSVEDSIDTRTAGGRLVLHVLGAVAQWEREAIGERTQEGMAEARRRGVVFGPARHAPAEAVARAQGLRQGGATLEAIAITLTQEGHATARGGAWSPSTVKRLLDRAAA